MDGILVDINPIEMVGSDPMDKLNISVNFQKGGINYYDYNTEKKGINVTFKPIRLTEFGHSCVITGDIHESGFKVFIKELGRKSQKQMDIVQAKIAPHAKEIADLWNENKHSEIVDLVKRVTA